MLKISVFQLIYVNLMFLFRLFSHSSFWQLQIRFKFCDQYVSQFSWSSYSDEFLIVFLNNNKRYSSFVINPMNNSWKCFSFMYLCIYVLWSNVWKTLDYVIYTCIAFFLFLKDYVITYKKGFSKILSFWSTPFLLCTIFFSDGPTLQVWKW